MNEGREGERKERDHRLVDPAVIILYQYAAPVGFAAFPGPSDNTTRRSNRSPTRSLPRPPLSREENAAVEEQPSPPTFLFLPRDTGDSAGSASAGERCRESSVCFSFLSSSGSTIPPGPGFFIRTILAKLRPPEVPLALSPIEERRWFPEEAAARSSGKGESRTEI